MRVMMMFCGAGAGIFHGDSATARWIWRERMSSAIVHGTEADRILPECMRVLAAGVGGNDPVKST